MGWGTSLGIVYYLRRMQVGLAPQRLVCLEGPHFWADLPPGHGILCKSGLALVECPDVCYGQDTRGYG